MPSLNRSKLVGRNPDRPPLKQRAASVQAAAARVMGEQASPAVSPPDADPIFAAIAASRAAEADMLAFGVRRKGRRMNPDVFREEDRLVDAQTRTRDFVFATVPTTRAGQIALAGYVRYQMGLFGMADGSPPDDDCQIWLDTHNAMLAALAAPVLQGEREPLKPDLSAIPLAHLGRLQEVLRSLSMHASGEIEAPYCWDEKRENYNATGDFLEAESDRLADLYKHITDEAERRSPINEAERDARLEALLRWELWCEGKIHNRNLLADINAAWGA